MGLIWQPRSRTYLDTATARSLSPRELVALRDAFTVQKQSQFFELALDLAEGRIGVGAWEARFAALLSEAQTTAFLFGRGGIEQMGDADYDALLDLIAKQHEFVEGFAGEVATGRMTPAQIPPRAQLYGGSVVEAHGTGQARAHGEELDLPCFPADGETDCHANCRCWWEIEETDTEWRATWHTEDDPVVCDGCRNRERQYNPFVQEK